MYQVTYGNRLVQQEHADMFLMQIKHRLLVLVSVSVSVCIQILVSGIGAQ